MNTAVRVSFSWIDAVAAGFARRLRRIARAYEAYAQARAHAAAIRHLEHLSDHTLHDIGLRRDQIHAAVGGEHTWL
ncbi:MAG: DUF1127 domain-containing protein [Burkholderiales bacterium]